MESGSALAWLVFLTFNLPIALALAAVPFASRLSNALKEKSPLGDSTGVTSYSRVIGAVGGVIVAAFFWAAGNVQLAMALDPKSHSQLTEMLDAFGRFLLFGSALFLPYAFNQLKSIFPWVSNAASNVAMLQKAAAVAQPFAPASPSRVTVVNLSDSIPDAELSMVLSAIQLQVSQHFGPEWRCSATLSSTRLSLPGKVPNIDGNADAVIYLGETSNSNKAGLTYAKGFHDQNVSGTPYGFVFLDICKLYKEPWSVTLSHEVLELLADPTASLSVADPQRGLQYALEVCDPTQGDHYMIDGVLVSNFVNRSFYGLSGGSGSMNYRQLPQAPFVPRTNGYVQFQDATGASQQTWGAAVTDEQKQARALMGDLRRNRRRAVRGQPPTPG